MARIILNVPDISCEHCERAITQTLSPQEGIKMVRVDIPGKQVALEYDDSLIHLEQVGELLEEEGYPVASAQPA